MKRHIRIIRFLTVLIISSIFIVGCSSSGNKTGATGIPSFNIEKLEPAKISFCFMGDGSGGQPHNVAAINEMLAELNKKTLKEINTEVSFQWIPYENYDSKLTELLKSDSEPDAFFTYNPESLCNEGLIKDITEILPQLAPHYNSLVEETRKDEIKYNRIDNKTYTILNNWLTFPRDCIIARKDLVDKYAPEGISDFKKYGEFLQKVKLYEKDITPGLLNPYDFFEAYMKGNGYFQGFIATMYCKWDAKDLIPIPVENTGEFNDAYGLYKQWEEKNLVIDYNDPTYEAVTTTGRLASMLVSGSRLHSIYNRVPFGYNYCTYTLYPDNMYLSSFPSESIGINANSTNFERVLIFIEWLQSSQENYDLFMYGIKDKQYKLQGNSLDISGLSYDNNIAGWSGSYAFMNYMYERPYHFEPAVYKDFVEKNFNHNTLSYYKVFDKFGYDMYKYQNMSKEDKAVIDEDNKALMNYSDARNKTYNNFMEKIRAYDFSKTLTDIMKEEGCTENNEKLAASFEAILKRISK